MREWIFTSGRGGEGSLPVRGRVEPITYTEVDGSEPVKEEVWRLDARNQDGNQPGNEEIKKVLSGEEKGEG